MDRQQQFIRRMITFKNAITIDDLAMLSGQEDPTQYKNKHKNIKKKTFSQPLDIKATDIYVDFCLHLDRQEYQEAKRFYFALKRMLGQ